jgi:hypothetical protein
MLCPHCGRAHYNPGKRKLAVRWGVGTRVRILVGDHKGKMADVSGVGREYVFVRIALGDKKHPQSEVQRFLPAELHRSSGPLVHIG